MPTLIAKCLAWLVRALAMLLLIVGVLVAIAWIKAEWDRMDAIEQDIARKESALGELRTELASLKDELAEEDQAWKAHLDELRVAMQAELALLNARVERAKPAWDRAIAHSQNVKTLASDARGKADRARAESQGPRKADQLVGPVRQSREAGRARDREGELCGIGSRRSFHRSRPGSRRFDARELTGPTADRRKPAQESAHRESRQVRVA